MLIHEPVRIRTSWGAHTIEGYYSVPALHHCRNFIVVSNKSRASCVIDAVEFRHVVVTVPKISPEDKLIHDASQQKRELASIPIPNKHDQIEAASNLRNLSSKHSKIMTNANKTTKKVHAKQKK